MIDHFLILILLIGKFPKDIHLKLVTNGHYKLDDLAFKCERDCDQMYGYLNKTRRCVDKKTGRDLKVNLCGEIEEENNRCYDPEYCSNIGEFTGVWSEWEANGNCILLPGLTCAFKGYCGLQKFQRYCKRTKKSDQIERILSKLGKKYEFKCPQTELYSDTKYEQCKV